MLKWLVYFILFNKTGLPLYLLHIHIFFINKYQYSNKMKCKSCWSDILKIFDLFSTRQFLRYDQNQDYQTVSGGVVSLLVIAIFLILFANNAISTINKTAITWESNTQRSFLGTNATLSFQPQSKQMVAMGIVGLNLNDPNIRYFDVQLVEIKYQNEVFSQIQRIPMVPCTVAHFSMTESIKNNFVSMGGGNKVCPPLNYSFQIFGRFSTNSLQMMEVRVSQCGSSYNDSRPCINTTTLDGVFNTFGELYASLFFVNPLINPGSTDYLDYYVEDANFVGISRKQGANSMGYVQDFKIETDESLLPYTATHTDQGKVIPQKFQIIPFQIYNSYFARFYFMRSSTTTTYERAFNKIDQFFSYIGGLVGTILGLMLFMEGFTNMSYELDLAQKNMRGEDQQKIQFSSFNVLTYLLYFTYTIGSKCGLCKSWKDSKKQGDCKEEITKQLDTSLFLQRFSFFQRSIQFLLRDKGVSEAQFYQLQTLSSLKKRRRKYRHFKKIPQDSRGESDSDSQSEDSSSEPSHPPSRNQVENMSIQHLNMQEPEVDSRRRRKRGKSNLEEIKSKREAHNISPQEKGSLRIQESAFDSNIVKVNPNEDFQYIEPNMRMKEEQIHNNFDFQKFS